MFTRSSASTLRHSIAAGETDRALVREYTSHYGLNFAGAASHEFQVFDSAGYSIVMQHFTVPSGMEKGTAFLLHGYFDHAGLYGKLIDHCLQQGFSVTICDWPGHGLSSGPEASIDSFARYSRVLSDCLEHCAASANQPWICIGQSTGAAVLVDGLLHHDLARRFSFARFILLAPLLRSAHWWRSKLSFALARWFIPKLKRNFSLNSHDLAFQDFLRNSDALQSRIIPRQWIAAMMDFEKRFRKARPVPQSLQIIQGTGDETVLWQQNLPMLEQKFPGSTSYLVADARHHLVNESAEYRERVFTLLDEIVETI